MAKFIQCSQPKVDYFHETINPVINLDLVTGISKGTYSIYPDNEGIPTISFLGIGLEWRYDKHGGEAKRDVDYEQLINIKL